MSPGASLAVIQLRQLVFYHIDNDLLETANFLAGRLYASDTKDPDNSHLLGLTYLRLRRFKAACDFTVKFGASGKHLGCSYVYAQACLALSRNIEGITALERAKTLWSGKSNWGKHTDTSRRHLPDAPAVLTVLAKLWQAHGDLKRAGDCYAEAHKANAFVWDAFEGLCKVGADLNVANMFRLPAEYTQSRTAVNGKSVIYMDDGRAPADTMMAPPPAPLFNAQVFDTPNSDPFGPSRAGPDSLGYQFALPNVKDKRTHVPNGHRHAATEWDTPTANGGSTDDDAGGEAAPVDDFDPADLPGAPTKRTQTYHAPDQPPERPRSNALHGHLHESTQHEDRRTNLGGQKRNISGHTMSSTQAAAPDGSAAPRRSNRLYGQTTSTRATRSNTEASSFANRVERATRAPRMATGARNRPGSVVGRVVSGNRKVLPPDPSMKDKEKEKRAPSRASDRSVTVPGVTSATIQKPAISAAAPASDGPSQAEYLAVSGLLENFRQLAVGTYSIARFDLDKAISTFRSLPAHARDNPWVLAQLGRAYYEAVNYPAAEECFARVLRLQPSRVEDMEVYSTILWHLRKESALACLCHMLKDQDFHAPQTWCAIGNAFSLARDHDQAIAAFKRATQVDDNFAYAWTLMGHEYIANEEFETALTAFRKAVAVDRRGYGGWYGLGKSYERMGKLEDAERHYRIASSINPSNATLLVCIGVVLERLQSRGAALSHYSKALELSPTSALARFKKARVLMQLRYFAEALVELEELRDQAPDEANVWFLLGKCYKGLGDKSEALRALTTALNLDVKAAPFIKEAMEALDDDDDDDSDMD